MHRIITLAALTAGILALAGCAQQNVEKWGTPMKDAPAKMSVAKVLADGPKLEGKPVRVDGYVAAVCPGAGCWMELTAAKDAGPKDERVFVWFMFDKTQSRVPVEAKGHKATVEGKLVMYEESVEEQKHFAEEKGMTRDEIDKTITKARKVARIEGAYVEIADIKAAAPQACEGEKAPATEAKDGKK